MRLLSQNLRFFLVTTFFITQNLFLEQTWPLIKSDAGSKLLVGPWSNGYQCGMRIPRSGFNSQRVPDHGC